MPQQQPLSRCKKKIIKSTILSSTSFQTGKVFLGVVRAAVTVTCVLGPCDCREVRLWWP